VLHRSATVLFLYSHYPVFRYFPTVFNPEGFALCPSTLLFDDSNNGHRVRKTDTIESFRLEGGDVVSSDPDAPSGFRCLTSVCFIKPS